MAATASNTLHVGPAEFKMKGDEMDDASKYAATILNTKLYPKVAERQLLTAQTFDSIHDEWDAPRGESGAPNADRKNAVIQAYLLNLIVRLNAKYGIGRTYAPVGEGNDNLMNALLYDLIGSNAMPVNVKKIEEISSKFYEHIDPVHNYDLDKIEKKFTYEEIVTQMPNRIEDFATSAFITSALPYSIWKIIPGKKPFKKLSTDEQKKIYEFIGTMIFKEKYYDPIFRYYLTIDGFSGSIAQSVLENDPKMNILITPANVADSASTGGINKLKTVASFFKTPDYVPGKEGEQVYISKNNAFSLADGYQIGMLNRNFELNKFDFDYILQKFSPDGKELGFTQAFNYAASDNLQGPSLNYLIDLTDAAMSGNLLSTPECESKQVCIGKTLQESFEAAVRKDIQEQFVNVMLDIKRCGDEDQADQALLAKQKLAYVILATGDRGLSDFAMINNLHNIYYNTAKGTLVIRRGTDPDAAYVEGIAEEKVSAEARFEARYAELKANIAKINVDHLANFITPATLAATQELFEHKTTKDLIEIKLLDIRNIIIEFAKKTATIVPTMSAMEMLSQYKEVNITNDMLSNIVDVFTTNPVFDPNVSYMFCNYSKAQIEAIENAINGMRPTGEPIVEPDNIKDIAIRPFNTALENLRTSLYTPEAINLASYDFLTVTGMTKAQLGDFEKDIRDYKTAMESAERGKRSVSLKLRGDRSYVGRPPAEAAALVRPYAMAATQSFEHAVSLYYIAMHGAPVAGGAAVGAGGAGAGAGRVGGGKKTQKQKGGGRAIANYDDLFEVTDAFKVLCGKASYFVNAQLSMLDPIVALCGNIADIQYRYSTLSDPTVFPGLVKWLLEGAPVFDAKLSALTYPVYNAYFTFFKALTNYGKMSVSYITPENLFKIATEPIYTILSSMGINPDTKQSLDAIIARTDPAAIEEVAAELTNGWMAMKTKYNDKTINLIYMLLNPYSTTDANELSLKYTHPLTREKRIVAGTTLAPLIAAYGGNANFAKMQALMVLTLIHDFLDTAIVESIFLPYITDRAGLNRRLVIEGPAEWTTLFDTLYIYYAAVYRGVFTPELAGLLRGGGLPSQKRRHTRRHVRRNKAPNPYKSYASIAKSLKARRKRRYTRKG